MELPRKGISKDDYQAAQTRRFDNDFVYETNQKLQTLQMAIVNLSENIDKAVASQVSDHKNSDIRISNFMELTINCLKEFRQQISDFQQEINAMNVLMDAFKKTLNECAKTSQVNEKFSLIDDEIKRIYGQREAFRKDFTQVLNRFSQEYDVKLKLCKEEILAIPSEIPSMKKVYDQKLELIELNGQNSVLRSSNNERQILLLEKKIENLYQLLKSIEITKKETL